MSARPLKCVSTRSLAGSSWANLKFVEEVVKRRDLSLEALALTDLLDDATGEGATVKSVTVHDVPVIEDALGEGLATGSGTEGRGETEGLLDGKVGLELHHGGADALLFGEHVTTAAREDTVASTHGILGDGNVDQVDGLEEAGLAGEHASVDHTAGGGEDLTHTTVDGISVKGNVKKVDAETTDGLFAERSVLGGPLEATDARFLDLTEV